MRYTVNQIRATQLFRLLRAAAAPEKLKGHVWMITDIQSLTGLDFNRSQKLFFWLIDKAYLSPNPRGLGWVLSEHTIRLITK